MAHITGGGLLENIPRILPNNCTAQIYLDAWLVFPIFKMMQKIGNLSQEEMYRTFNMGIGYVLIVDEKEITTVLQKMQKYYRDFNALVIGEIICGERIVKLA